MTRINPLYLFIALNVAIFLFGDWLIGDQTARELAAEVDNVARELGWVGYGTVVGLYVVCAFLFVPVLIGLNVICGALYGPWIGTAVSIVGITLGAIASTISVRHVFTGMQAQVDARPYARRLLTQIGRHGAVVVLMLRLAFVVPYLLQNIVLALAPIGIVRLVLLTAVGALPGAVIYSFLGAGLMRSTDAETLAVYLAVPLLLLVVVVVVVRYLNARYEVL